jgi:hypothetical protein
VSGERCAQKITRAEEKPYSPASIRKFQGGGDARKFAKKKKANC